MDLNYKKDDFRSCILNTIDLPMSTDLMKTFPLLSELSGFEYDFKDYPNPVVDKNKTIRYINYFYSKGTPLEKDYTVYKQRKVAAAVLAGFGYNGKTGEFDKKITEMLEGKDPMVNRMIISLLKHNYSTRFDALMSLRDMFHRALEDVNDPAKVTKVFEISDKLVKMEMEMLNNDESQGLSVALIQRMEEIKLELKPEDVAIRIASGMKPIDFELYG